MTLKKVKPNYVTSKQLEEALASHAPNLVTDYSEDIIADIVLSSGYTHYHIAVTFSAADIEVDVGNLESEDVSRQVLISIAATMDSSDQNISIVNSSGTEIQELNFYDGGSDNNSLGRLIWNHITSEWSYETISSAAPVT